MNSANGSLSASAGRRADPGGGPAAGAAPAGSAMTGPSYVDDLDRRGERWSRNRRRWIRSMIVLYLTVPFWSHRLYVGPHSLSTPRLAFLAVATAATIALTSRLIFPVAMVGPRQVPWAGLIATVGLSVAILAVGGQNGSNWVAALVVASAAVGRTMPTLRLVVIGAAVCTAAGVSVYAMERSLNSSNSVAFIVPPLAACFAYSASRRLDLVNQLRETRAELARMAVADERLRIARDLHDLLGHSLSLITLKAELAGRLLEADPDRAAREIADLEAVARRSLGEVRAAVTSYRQPSLAAELGAARHMLAAAGMDCQVDAPTSIALPPAVDALLAWTVREGTTNVVRHSGARTVTITITVTPDGVSAEIADDGVGPALDAAPRPGEHQGSGLSGLAERARTAGAEVSSGEGPGGKGFRLLVRVPVAQFSSPAVNS
jgi:two-component system, NarL family, sensor histidine kinase DesK